MKKTASFCGSSTTTKYWQALSRVPLTDKEVRLFEEQLDWEIVAKEGDLSLESWINHFHRFQSGQFELNQTVPASFYNTLKNDVNWGLLEKKRIIAPDFLLEVCQYFSTISFARDNVSAAFIDETTWDYVMKRNDEVFECSTSPGLYIRTQFVSMDSLRKTKSKWKRDQWELISRKQRLTFDFVKEHIDFLHTRAIEEDNPFHGLSKEELRTIRQLVSDSYDEMISLGVAVNWDLILEQYVFTREFLNRHGKAKIEA